MQVDTLKYIVVGLYVTENFLEGNLTMTLKLPNVPIFDPARPF